MTETRLKTLSSQAPSLAFSFVANTPRTSLEPLRASLSKEPSLKTRPQPIPEPWSGSSPVEKSGFPHAVCGVKITLGTTVTNGVERRSTYPHVEKPQGHMGKILRSLNQLSPDNRSRYWLQRRTCSVFPSIPIPYYDDYDHVYISLRKS